MKAKIISVMLTLLITVLIVTPAVAAPPEKFSQIIPGGLVIKYPQKAYAGKTLQHRYIHS